MEKGIIKNVSIEDFKTNENFVNYVDDDFMVINSLENVPYSNGTVRLNCFLLISCLEGSIQLDMNDKTYQLQKDDLIFGLPSVIISHTMLSPQHKISIIGFSTQFLQRVFKMGKFPHLEDALQKLSGETDDAYFVLRTQHGMADDDGR